jgi:hypothetical protein
MRRKYGLSGRKKSYKFLLKQGFLDTGSGLPGFSGRISVILDLTPAGFFYSQSREGLIFSGKV